MSSAVAELDAGLQAMLSLKPPGVSGSRISSLTTLCTTNVQSESVLIQKLYTHFKKAPATHKLGVLYVVDSVTRKWTEQAKSAGQPINSSAQDGTFAAGVHRVKELLPVLMNDMILSSPEDQKDKIRKLLDIWEKSMTFPLQMLDSFKAKLNAQNASTTPPGSPPTSLQTSLYGQPTPDAAPAGPARNTSSILQALANMAPRNTAAPAANPYQQSLDVNSSYNVSNGHINPAPQVPALTQLPFSLPVPVNVPVQAATAGSSNSAPSYFSNNQFPAAAAPPPVAPPVDPALQQQLQLIKTLADQGMQVEQIANILAAMGQAALPAPLPFAAPNQPAVAAQNGWGAPSRDRTEAAASPPSRFRRSRSRSPKPEWNARDSPASRRRGEPNFDHDKGFPDRNRGHEDRERPGWPGGRGNEYRQRSPPRRAQSPSPPRFNNGSQKWISHDPTIKSGHIKVLSRTLFVGGVTTSEHDLRSLFSKFGQVQTCIVNTDKRHAFVKMVSRQDALTAKESMEKHKSPESQLRTRWGVGFGPRDCSDYQTGVSIIPINALTEADRKWMLTAEYGGTGGKPMETGMVVEEPDIEIGQGVSSKAMSRRMQTDQAGANGPKSTRKHPEEREEHPRSRRGGNHRRDEGRKESRVSGPPAMPSIPPFGMAGFPFGMPNGMPMLPQGFPAYPGFPGVQDQATQQPPPPGRRS